MIVPQLRTLLANERMSITTLSRKTGIPRATLTLFADDKTTGIRYETLNKISIALGVHPMELFLFIPYDVGVTVDFSHCPPVDFADKEDSTYRYPCAYRLTGARDLEVELATDVDIVQSKKHVVVNLPRTIQDDFLSAIPALPKLVRVSILRKLAEEICTQLAVPEGYEPFTVFPGL